ncbi:AMP-dependent synthetase/ligase [Roseisolibacter agri]|uniref:Long-chain acyl-CoA synthetase n=1 Tax=Roseisolibacter agri TaxID=2014610 RepID=A0AA37QIY4_9BACT|nr:AMP-binding protein [Roseisolibacter agri]GLC27723.1 long-chain acyl-CoA synthetase [Roseisolibacter agri]
MSGAPGTSFVAWAQRMCAATAHDTVLRRLLARAAAHPSHVAYRELAVAGADGDTELTWAEWTRSARAVAAALVQRGLQVGARVAVLAGNRMLWPIVDLGILMAGGMSVGIFPTSTQAQVRQLLLDGGVRLLFCDDAAQLEKAGAACSGLDAAPTIVADLAHMLDAGHAALDDAAVEAELDRRIAAAAPDDLAILIYTSGSTGEPKGACLTHAYLVASAESIRDTLGLTASDRSLSLLPYAHAAERVFGLYTRLVCGMEAVLVPDPSRLADAARAFRPTLLGGLPRLYEKLHATLEQAERAATGEERETWARLRALGAERSRLRRAGAPVPETMEREWQAVRGAAAAVIKRAIGDAVRLATSGGAPLRRDVAESLDAVGLTVLGAYGQTEHLCVAFHRPDAYDFAGVGRPMEGTTLRIAADGEIQVRRNALTFAGYLGRPEATQAAFTADGAWLRTGDLGAIDARGILHVTGRLKEILALSTGKKVAPLPIEARLREHRAVSQALVAGEGRRFATALLFVPAADDEAEVRRALDAHVAQVNDGLAPHERIARWALVPEELTEAGGELTPTLKVRRSVVEAKYHAVLEELYA